MVCLYHIFLFPNSTCQSCFMKEYIWPKISFIVCFIMLAFGRYFVPITLRGLVDKKFWAISLEKRAETQRNALPFGSSMAERQLFGCLDTWPCTCRQTLSMRVPIAPNSLGPVNSQLFLSDWQHCVVNQPKTVKKSRNFTRSSANVMVFLMYVFHVS